ncbi:rhamnogalacturonan lyase B N-terminal domain-containing protein [Paenibacillus sp. RC67]|uniref:rhamnogalacturonan lyase B N-terminal domain-containing protein n=1 Tax=Paenibacillus sp. RC67 TaxID=3039392 RepID=UPI0024ACAEFB|nr:rhamnogalacturonan lyase B N-terminal domain-containing protein [Paenibacillus sp. RC67]
MKKDISIRLEQNSYPSSYDVRFSIMRKLVVILLAMVIVVGASLFHVNIGYAAGIGVTDNGSTIVVDTGAGLVYTINKSNGDMISCKLNGIELTTSSGKYSQIASGFGSATVTWNTSSSGSIVTITATSTAIMSNSGSITHYYVSRAGENNIYMATYTTTEPSVGELRYIFRGNSNVLTNVPPNSNNSGNNGNVESTDVFSHSDGTTTSKYYGNDQESPSI